MATEAQPSLVIQALFPGIEVTWFDRWFDSVVSSLVGAQEVGVLARWRITVRSTHLHEKVDASVRALYERRASQSGGEFSLMFLDTDSNDRELDRRALEAGNDELVLFLSPESLLLSSTVVRMVRAVVPDFEAIIARELPLDRLAEDDLGAAGMPEGSASCVLYRRSALRNSGFNSRLSGGVGTESRQPTHPTGATTLDCPSAVVFRDKRISIPDAPLSDSGGCVGEEGGSLLEAMISAPPLDAARDIVVRALTAPGMALVSIVMRTQVRRPEALRDALLCLAGQSDGRFELLLVVHNSDPEDARDILDDQPEWLRSRTQILTASGGTRSHPLNVGIAAARGTHVAFLDDDDLVFAHWVESFLTASLENPRRVLRASAGVQRVRTAGWEGGIGGHVSEPLISAPYPRVFNLADHLRVNMTPFMAFAFPRGFFAVFGGADETLEVCEDWDLVLRAASILGVADVPALTAIYRRWSSGDDSYSVHESAIWERDMARVRSKLDSSVLLLPAGSASELEQFSATSGVSAELAAVYGSSSWRITAPMRATARWARRFQKGVVTLFRGRGN